ncbi:hypothetical protein Ciccas_002555 [Cichlidogyrus casuarinus]|uniref:Cornifelin n=1 Tax=Cichlidogyrus casuarinus TaxID=1844966 RepID=A0ABD2QGX1_9PLAT
MTRSPPRDWHHGMCDCTNDIANCLCVLCCPSCAFSEMWGNYGGCCCSYMCVPAPLIALRTYHRGRHNISGSIFKDSMASIFCTLCTLCQMRYDMNRMKACGDL